MTLAAPGSRGLDRLLAGGTGIADSARAAGRRKAVSPAVVSRGAACRRRAMREATEHARALPRGERFA